MVNNNNNNNKLLDTDIIEIFALVIFICIIYKLLHEKQSP